MLNDSWQNRLIMGQCAVVKLGNSGRWGALVVRGFANIHAEDHISYGSHCSFLADCRKVAVMIYVRCLHPRYEEISN